MLRFLSKLVLICNVCFALSVILRYLERSDLPGSGPGAVNPLPFYLQWVLLLGVAALLLNLLLVVGSSIWLLLRKELPYATWLLVINGFFLLLQIIYYLT